MTKEEIADQVLSLVPKGFELVRIGAGVFKGEHLLLSVGKATAPFAVDQPRTQGIVLRRKAEPTE